MGKTLGPAIVIALAWSGGCTALADAPQKFHLEEATITRIQDAILNKQLTTTQLVELYLKRVKAYNGTCVKQPQGLLGPVMPIANAGQVNALSTLNLRPASRKKLRFDDRKARSMTDAVDMDPNMPDAFEAAADLDRQFAATGKFVGPLHGVVIAIKDQYDTFDMRTTSGGDAPYANDRPPDDATFVKNLRAAGAIILGKANMGEYAAGYRSSFGGTFCNPYDTERSPGGSSGGSGSAVATNMVTCAIAEESGPSVRSPAKNNNSVGISPTQELVSRDGMIPASYMNDRVGPICRTVEDAARVLDVITGYDPKDELTVFGIGRKPSHSYATFAKPQSLAGVRIGVVREYMDKALFSPADAQSIDIIEREVQQLKKLGADVVDPGPGGALFQTCLQKYLPAAHQINFTQQYPQAFPVDANGKPTSDHLNSVVGLFFDQSAFPTGATLRSFGPAQTTGERRYGMNRYLKERGDPNIKDVNDLLMKSRFYDSQGGAFMDKKQMLENTQKDMTLDVSKRVQVRFSLQQVALQCMAELKLDAITYPTSNIPAQKIGAPNEPTINDRPSNAWSFMGQQGFPTITVPAGFTTQVYDRVANPADKEKPRLIGPVAAKVPVGIDFLARPFDEPMLIRIAAAYEAATRHRQVPSGFGPLKGEP
jgi:amidase